MSIVPATSVRAKSLGFRYNPGNLERWELDKECANPPHPVDAGITDFERIQLVDEGRVWISERDLVEKVRGMDLNLGQHTAEWMVLHQRYSPIPKIWREGYTLLPATRWRRTEGSLKGTLYVPTLYWEVGEWRLYFFPWLFKGTGRRAHVLRVNR